MRLQRELTVLWRPVYLRRHVINDIIRARDSGHDKYNIGGPRRCVMVAFYVPYGQVIQRGRLSRRAPVRKNASIFDRARHSRHCQIFERKVRR